MTAQDARVEALLAAEQARCDALVERDVDRLDALLHPDLTHTHTPGNTEDKKRYLSLLRGPMQYLALDRRETNVRLHGATGILDGVVVTTGRLGSGDPMSLETKVLQVWLEEDGDWRMVAFQATRVDPR
ncbi:nuclear transport factor 2 family protein [Streptomyces sp. NPDC004044]